MKTGSAVIVLAITALAMIASACGSQTATQTSSPAVSAAPTEADVQATPSPTPTEEAPSGIVVFRLRTTMPMSAELTLVDPDTGAATPWRTFDAESAGIPALYLKSFPQTLEVAQALAYSLTRYLFSPDFSCMVATSRDNADGSQNVGWLTADGEYVDVTAAAHAGDSDFADAPQDTGPSFGEDGLFYWYDKNDSKFKRVDPSNVEPSAVEAVSKDEACRAFGLKNLDGKEGQYVYESRYVSDSGLYATSSTGTFASWIDGKRYLVENPFMTGDPTIAIAVATASPNADSGQDREFLPASDRSSWNPVVSPGRDQVAFLSRNPDQAGIELFVVPAKGGDPSRVDTDYDFIDFEQTGQSSMALGPEFHLLLAWL